MKLSQAFLACFCLLVTTQLAWSQVKAPAAHTIPGYLDPATGKFTTRAIPEATAQPNATAPTAVFFREDFQIYIANYDQKGTSAVCEVDLTSYGDAIGVDYTEQASVPATALSSGFSCDVPVLTSWTLQSPSTDMISATVTVYIYSATTQTTSVYLYPANYRSSSQSLTLTQPANGATAVQSIKFAL